MKVASVVGARPQFIKMAPVSEKLRECCEEVVIHTGQHYDYEMNGVFFDELQIPKPDYNLGVGSGPHGWQTGEMLKRIEEVLLKEKPDIVFVYGDTNSTLAGALAAVKLHIPVAHVEAGLRSFDRRMPEEINRVLTDHASDILFAPTETAVDNLKKEGIVNGVHLVGDVMVDALYKFIKIAKKKSNILEELDIVPKGYILATVHRASNTDNEKNLRNIIEAFMESGEIIVFPAHLRTVNAMKRYGILKDVEGAENIKLIKPVGYFDMLILEKNAKKIVTDSGGLQKEAYTLKIPCITLRENTEWIETVEDEWNVLVGTDKEKILEMIREFSPSVRHYSNRFGDGRAAERIVEIIDKKIELGFI